MKKFVAGLAVVLGVTAGAAGAANAAGSYPPPVEVQTHVDVPNHTAPHHPVPAEVQVTAPGANPKGGHVRIVITNAHGKIVAILRKPYSRKLSFEIPGLRKGSYTLTSAYVGKKGTVFTGSRAHHKLKVG